MAENVESVEGKIVCAVAAGAILHADRDKMIVRHVITTGALNRLNQRVMQAGADVEEYRKNPIVLWNHDDSQPAIGKNSALDRDGDRWIARTMFAPTPLGREIYSLYEGGYMTSWSIGFKPVETTYIKNENGDLSEIVFNRWKLLEYSAVPIPANADAVTMALRKNVISESTYRMFSYAEELALEVGKDEGDLPASALDSLATMRQQISGGLARKFTE